MSWRTFMRGDDPSWRNWAAWAVLYGFAATIAFVQAGWQWWFGPLFAIAAIDAAWQAWRRLA